MAPSRRPPKIPPSGVPKTPELGPVPLPLEQISDAALTAEQNRRYALREAARKEKQERHVREVRETLTHLLVDVFQPEHGLTSCSDANVANGFKMSEGEKGFRCTRCALLDLLNYSDLPDGFTVRLELRTM